MYLIIICLQIGEVQIFDCVNLVGTVWKINYKIIKEAIESCGVDLLASIFVTLPIYTPGWREALWELSVLPNEHNTPASARTWTA